MDYLLKNGIVIDPKNSIEAKKDILIINGKISKIKDAIEPSKNEKVFDLSGLYITPGLVDSHVHCYHSTGIAKAWAGDYSFQPDYFSFRAGVTTMVDVGSSGSYNFEHFKATVIDRAKTRIYAFLNICDYGMSSLNVEQFPQKNDVSAAIECIKNNKDLIKGIKIAHYWGKDWADVECAKKIQESVDLPIMVDFGVFKKERPYDVLLMEKLRKGDITTHCFRSAVPVLDKNGKVYDYLYKAKEKGIVFDLGHGAASFMMRNAVPAMQQGFLPDSFSSDLHGLSLNGTVLDMANLLSKIMACCSISLSDLFARVTCMPADFLKLDEGIGSLSVGVDADIAVWNIREGNFGFQDMSGGKINGQKRLECEMTFRAGEIVWDLNARDGVNYKTLPSLYGLSSEEDLVEPIY